MARTQDYKSPAASHEDQRIAQVKAGHDEAAARHNNPETRRSGVPSAQNPTTHDYLLGNGGTASKFTPNS